MARVFPVVARELVRAGELPAAALPVAVVRLLPWKRRQQLGARQKPPPNKTGRGRGRSPSCPATCNRCSAPARGRNINLFRCTCPPPPPTAIIPSPLLISNLPTSWAPLGAFACVEEQRGLRAPTCVCAVMRFEVGALRVGFPTSDVVARVCGHSLPRPGAPAAFGLGFLRQAVPTGDHEGLCRTNRAQSADSTPQTRRSHLKASSQTFWDLKRKRAAYLWL